MKFDNPYNIFLDDNPLELIFPSNNSYKGSSTKEGSNSKAIAKILLLMELFLKLKVNIQ